MARVVTRAALTRRRAARKKATKAVRKKVARKKVARKKAARKQVSEKKKASAEKVVEREATQGPRSPNAIILPKPTSKQIVSPKFMVGQRVWYKYGPGKDPRLCGWVMGIVQKNPEWGRQSDEYRFEIRHGRVGRIPCAFILRNYITLSSQLDPAGTWARSLTTG